MSDYGELLQATTFWEADAEKLYESTAIPAVDCALQIREEVALLCQWIEEHRIRSYLELGIWTGRLLGCLQQIFSFQKCAACDLELARNFELDITLPEGTQYFHGNSLSPIFVNWRRKLGRVGLTVIDTDRLYDTVRANFEINRSIGSDYIAIVGIAPNARGEQGAREFWKQLGGTKVELLAPHRAIGQSQSTIGIGIWSP